MPGHLGLHSQKILSHKKKGGGMEVGIRPIVVHASNPGPWKVETEDQECKIILSLVISLKPS